MTTERAVYMSEMLDEYTGPSSTAQERAEHLALWQFGACSAEFARRPSALAYRALVEAMDRYQNACNGPNS